MSIDFESIENDMLEVELACMDYDETNDHNLYDLYKRLVVYVSRNGLSHCAYVWNKHFKEAQEDRNFLQYLYYRMYGKNESISDLVDDLNRWKRFHVCYCDIDEYEEFRIDDLIKQIVEKDTVYTGTDYYLMYRYLGTKGFFVKEMEQNGFKIHKYMFPLGETIEKALIEQAEGFVQTSQERTYDL